MSSKLYLMAATVVLSAVLHHRDPVDCYEALQQPAAKGAKQPLAPQDLFGVSAPSNNNNAKWAGDKNDNSNDDNAEFYHDDDEQPAYQSAPAESPVPVYARPPKQQNQNPYGPKPLSPSSSAQVIPYQQQEQTLDDIYGQRGGQSAYEQQANRRRVLLFLPFERDFAQWNPRSNDSQWEWTDGGRASYAAFLRYPAADDGSNNKNGDYETNKYGRKMNDDDDIGYVDLISLPFANTTTGIYQGAVRMKANITTRNTQRTLYRMKYLCKTYNTENHPFPASLVSKPWDDLRLANCKFEISPQDTNGFFYFSVTNKAVWAVAGTYTGTTAQSFVAKRRVGICNSYNDIVDAGLEFDARSNVINYYLNGYRVWTVTPGVPPANDGINKIDYDTGTAPQVERPSTFRVYFGTSSCLDESDPNNPNDRVRLVKVIGDDPYFYGANDTFYDSDNLFMNNYWGQGAKMRLIKLLVVQTESVPPQPPRPLPGDYGNSARKYL